MELLGWMEQWNMLPQTGGTVLCAVSGGRDSVCLLHYLCSVSDACGFSVAAAHYNHHMRPTAQRDEDFVRELCRQLRVPFYTDGADVVAVAAEMGRGVEETGRLLRYAYLEEVADQIGAERIATAHHMGDQAETVLLNLLRGTGPEGLAGIPPKRGRLIRPLLNTPRQEIELYLQRNALGHVEDETNDSMAFSRNRLRQKVLPELEKINPALRQNIARTAAIVRGEDDYLNALAGEYLPREGTEIPCDSIRSAPPVLRSRIVRLLIARLEAGKKDVSAVHIEAVVQLALEGRGGMVSLPAGMVALCRSGRLKLTVTQVLPEAMALQEGENRWGAWTVTVRRVPWDAPRKDGALYLRGDAPEGGLLVDGWQGSDRMTLPESRGARSVKRLLTERGIPPEERSATPCIRAGGKIAAVCGVGIDTAFAPKEQEDSAEITFCRKV